MIQPRRHFKIKRQAIIISGSVIVVGIIGGYIFWSNSTWAGYHTAYSQWKDETKGEVDAALGLPATTSSEREKKLQALKVASEAIASSDRSLCNINGMVSWQQSVSATYKKWLQECASTRDSLGSLNQALASVAGYMESEHRLASILSSALEATKSKVTEGTFSGVLTKWKAAMTDVKALKASAEFAPVKTEAQRAVGGVESAWQALITAHAAKDETKYQAALRSLTAAYSTIANIQQVSSKQFTQLSGALVSAYKADL